MFRLSNPFKYLFRSASVTNVTNSTNSTNAPNANNIINKNIIEETSNPSFSQTQNYCTKNDKKNYLVDGDDIKWEDTIPFSFPIEGGRVIKVYDGDTITIASRLPFDKSPLYRLSVRLNGIDTPEIKGKNDDEKTLAKQARDASAALILNKYVSLKNVQSEKYGRILADVYLGDLHLNEWMIKERYAVKYDGGTKKSPSSWLKYHITGEI
jgi:micrococcal nuclease